MPVEDNICDCKPSILVVDDTEFNIMAVRCLVKDHFDIDVDEAKNGKIALEMYKKGFDKKCKCPDRAYKLIFMDL